jgi:hypothetical protein
MREMSSSEGRENAIQTSWAHNADAWTAAVRDGRIESRRAGTDAAILAACERAGLGRVLDVGCGEGAPLSLLMECRADQRV